MFFCPFRVFRYKINDLFLLRKSDDRLGKCEESGIVRSKEALKLRLDKSCACPAGNLNKHRKSFNGDYTE